MSPAFQEALAARSLWINVMVFTSIEGCEAQAEAALATAYDAVYQLASNDVLTYRHYGPQAPIVLQDVPQLAEQYVLAYELYSEIYVNNWKNGSIGKLSAAWLKPSESQPLPYTKWLAAVTLHIAEIMQPETATVADVMRDQLNAIMYGWARGESPVECAMEVDAVYECMIVFEEEEAHRKHCEDMADTYASIEADLCAGWREDCIADGHVL